MHTDSFYMTGSQHAVCQDYAIVGNCEDNNGKFGIVCDGCSSSLHTDVGARIFSWNATKELAKQFGKEILNQVSQYKEPFSLLNIYEIKESLFINSFISSSINMSLETANQLSLPENSLDSTFLFVISNGQKCLAVIIGDGYIMARKKGGKVIAFQSSYIDYAPLYPSYLLNPERMEKYFKSYKGERTVETFNLSNNEVINLSDCRKGFVFGIVFDVECFDIIGVASDGLASFPDINWQDVVLNMMSFKTTTGCFVQRRMKRYLNDMLVTKQYPVDDVSMAAICF